MLSSFNAMSLLMLLYYLTHLLRYIVAAVIQYNVYDTVLLSMQLNVLDPSLRRVMYEGCRHSGLRSERVNSGVIHSLQMPQTVTSRFQHDTSRVSR